MPTGTEVSIVLVDDPTIKELNRRFLNKNRPTDVLAFPLVPGNGGSRDRGIAIRTSKHTPRLLGEIVISVDRARAQAKTAGHPVWTEVALLAVHGVLHLAGYDDRSPAQAAQMDRRQRQMLRALGAKVRG